MFCFHPFATFHPFTFLFFLSISGNKIGELFLFVILYIFDCPSFLVSSSSFLELQTVTHEERKRDSVWVMNFWN
jgi:hypothetical protein